MENARKFRMPFLCTLFLSLWLSACSSGGDPAVATGPASGVAVDPYIVGAVFNEVDINGSALQQSTPSNELGQFSFDREIQQGSTIVMDTEHRGQHGNGDFAGLLKRPAGSGGTGPFTVSPLTTLLANGMTSTEIVEWLADSGLPGLSAEDILADPMIGLAEKTTNVSNEMLLLLQANMAVNAFLEARQDFDYAGPTGGQAADLPLAEMVSAVQSTLSAASFESLAQTVPGTAPLLLGDLIEASVELQRTITARVQEEIAAGPMPNGLMSQLIANSQAAAPGLVTEIIQGRMGGSTPGGPQPSRNGMAVYSEECAGCHIMGSFDPTGNIDLASKGTALVVKIGGGHMNKSLPQAELDALADFADSFTPPSPPVMARSGQAIYDSICTACHSLNGYDNGSSTAPDLAGKGLTAETKVGGGHGGAVSAEELPDLGTFLDNYTPPAPPVVARTGQAIYDSVCTSCHALNGYDNGSSSAPDLAGKGATAETKVGGGHGGAVSADELLDLSAFLNTYSPPAPPVVARTGQAIYDNVCTSCHSLNGYDNGNSSAPDLAGKGATAETKVGGGHGGAVSAGELIDLSTFLNTYAPPAPPAVTRSGQEVYDGICTSCHFLNGYDNGSGSAPDLAGKGTVAVSKIKAGHGGAVSDLEQPLLSAWLNSFTPPAPPVVARTGQAIYDSVCTSCHALNGYDNGSSSAPDLAGKGATAETKVGGGHGGAVSAGELIDLSAFLNTYSPPAPPVVARTGQAIYDSVCTSCHALNGYDNGSSSAPDLAGKGATAETKVGGGHGGAVSAGELIDLSAFLDSYSPPAPPVVARTGQAIYDSVCTSCHALNGYDNGSSSAPDLAGKGATAETKVGGGHGGAVSAGELIDLSAFLDTYSPPAPPVVARTGQAIYDSVCTSCHALNGYDNGSSSAPDLAGKGATAETKVGGGHGGAVSATELIDLGAWLDTFTPSADPYAGSCTACHSQPPDGAAFPNTAGAHQAHAALPGVGTDCAVCHTGASHNDWVDLAFPSTRDAKSGAATDNLDGTCSNIRCHGGVKTPDWSTGAIQVATQCQSCHVSGTTEYNGYWSGKHRKHVVSKGKACTVCHDTTKLAASHFSNLSTTAFEQAPRDTIKSSLGYNGSSCATPGNGCHGRESW